MSLQNQRSFGHKTRGSRDNNTCLIFKLYGLFGLRREEVLRFPYIFLCKGDPLDTATWYNVHVKTLCFLSV